MPSHSRVSRCLLGLAPLVLLAGLAGCGQRPPTLVLSVGREELQQAVAERFPVEKEKLLVSVAFEDPRVILQEGDSRIGLDVAVRVKTPFTRPYQGRVAARGEVAYDPATRSFFFRNPEVTRLDLPGVGAELRGPAEEAIEALAGPALDSTPVYTLKDRSNEERLAGYLLRETSVRNGRLNLTLGLPPGEAAPPLIPGWVWVVLIALAVGFGAGYLSRRRAPTSGSSSGE